MLDLKTIFEQAPIKTVRLSQVFFPRKNSRRLTDSDNFQELKNSIQTTGQVTPVLVRQHRTIKNKYFVVSGFRRVHAMRLLTLKTIVVRMLPYLSGKDLVKLAQGDNNTITTFSM